MWPPGLACEAWFGESRLKAAEAKDDMGAFVNVQLEMFLLGAKGPRHSIGGEKKRGRERERETERKSETAARDLVPLFYVLHPGDTFEQTRSWRR